MSPKQINITNSCDLNNLTCETYTVVGPIPYFCVFFIQDTFLSDNRKGVANLR